MLGLFRRRKKDSELELTSEIIEVEDASRIKEPFEEVEERPKIVVERTQTIAVRPSLELILSAFLLINALVLSFLAGLIVHVEAIATKYSERIAAINPQYLNYLDAGWILAVSLLVYALISAFLSAYYAFEAKTR